MCACACTQVKELADPVQDARGFIYDKAAITAHIKQNARNGPVKCPMAGAAERHGQLCMGISCGLALMALAAWGLVRGGR